MVNVVKIGKHIDLSKIQSPVLVNYATSSYSKAQAICSWTAEHIAGFKSVMEYTDADIDEEFLKKNKNILNISRGAGLWLWKPYVIDKTMKLLQDGDILFYCDVGAFFFRTFEKEIEKVMLTNIWAFELPLIEKQFTKQETFDFMNCEADVYRKTNQISATIIGIYVNSKSRAFVREWLQLCTDIRLISPEIYKHPNPEGFISHREDQSIFSLLFKKYNFQAHLDPSQFGKYPKKYFVNNRVLFQPRLEINFHPCVIHHRTQNVEFINCFKQWLLAVAPYEIGKQMRIWKHPGQ